MNSMHRETLRAYLHNQPLVQAIEQKKSIDATKNELCQALQILRETGVSENVVSEVQTKCEEYSKISRNYGNLLESTWEISWQDESIIRKYTSFYDNDVDRLPEYIKFD